MNETKPFVISKNLVMQAFKLVKANAGAAGIDQESLKDFEVNLKNNLYKIWNRMSSGSYFPPPVKAVAIPNKSGGIRILGIPTVSDRVAQMIVKLIFEPEVEKHFLSDSYGYRPNKSAHDAISITRRRCWEYDWLIEYDIEGLFDNIEHDLLIKAVNKHTNCSWIKLYIKRWLKTPTQLPDGSLQPKTKGIMQGGVISPVLSNLFLHYVFDYWMTRRHPDVKWCRYADDGLIHCKTMYKANILLKALNKRFEECKLKLHPDKTKIVYCKQYRFKTNYPIKQFDFLGYTFRSRWVKRKSNNSLFLSFTPGVSKKSIKMMKEKIQKGRLAKRSDLSIEEIAKYFNPILIGWINYFGKFNRSSLNPLLWHFNNILILWAKRKFKRLKNYNKAASFINKLIKQKSGLFIHWKTSIVNSNA